MRIHPVPGVPGAKKPSTAEHAIKTADLQKCYRRNEL
jgi:hypothetical protein